MAGPPNVDGGSPCHGNGCTSAVLRVSGRADTRDGAFPECGPHGPRAACGVFRSGAKKSESGRPSPPNTGGSARVRVVARRVHWSTRENKAMRVQDVMTTAV